jgi:hypothetical protein
MMIEKMYAKNKAAFALEFSQIFIGRARKYEDENRELRDNQFNLQAQLSNCRNILSEREAILTDIEAKRRAAEKVVEEKEQDLAREGARYNEMVQHLEQKRKHEVNRQASKIKKYFAFEISEAILSLDSSRLDTEMALSRLRHMQEYLEKNMEQAND